MTDTPHLPHMATAPAGLGKFERYLIEEFYDDYREGTLPRRTFFRRVAYITGGMATAAATLAAMGCTGKDLPNPKASICGTERPARCNTFAIIGTSTSEWRFSARTSSTNSSPPRRSATEHSSVEVSTAKMFNIFINLR